MTATLLAAGAVEVRRDEAALVIVNTCTVTGEAETKTRKAIRQALKGDRRPWVIATGCAIAVDRETFEALGEKVIAEPDRELALRKALDLLGVETPAADTLSRTGGNFNRRMGIKIQDGCDNRCSYCIVPTARGAARSLSFEGIVSQVVAAERSGVREVVLTGVNIGGYTDNGATLAVLVDGLLQATSKLRVRLSSLEPQHADDALFAVMAASEGRLCAHLHLPLQSGCDTTLKAMRRLYDTEFFAERVKAARALMPRLALTTDVIVGFPGETDDDFRRSSAFCERMRFSRMHVFRYSKRPGTPAAERLDQVAPQVSAERASRLRESAAAMEAEDLAARVGTTENVCVERVGRGMSESYHRVAVSADRAAGSLVPVHFTSVRANLLVGL
jgi:threonylcarbamoyladenosine tRNA methylthiotransferase MtaB